MSQVPSSSRGEFQFGSIGGETSQVPSLSRGGSQGMFQFPHRAPMFQPTEQAMIPLSRGVSSMSQRADDQIHPAPRAGTRLAQREEHSRRRGERDEQSRAGSLLAQRDDQPWVGSSNMGQMDIQTQRGGSALAGNPNRPPERRNPLSRDIFPRDSSPVQTHPRASRGHSSHPPARSPAKTRPRRETLTFWRGNQKVASVEVAVTDDAELGLNQGLPAAMVPRL